jgi:hypothetical protein
MTITHAGRRALLAALAIAALALLGLTLAGSTHAAGAQPKHQTQRLVVRGEDRNLPEGPCAATLCAKIADGSFRGTLGTGAYSGALKIRVAESYDNGEHGVCAPVQSRLELGAGSPDRVVIAASGESCQDGAGPVATAPFTTVLRFKVVGGAGAYAGATGAGLAVVAEDDDDHDRMTLIGRITTRAGVTAP